MQGVFLKIVLMGINASWMIFAVLLLRLFFRKSPKWIVCFLWILVGIRLICPYDMESAMSLVPVQIKVPFIESEKNTNNEKNATYIQIDHNSFVDSNIKFAKRSFQLQYTDGIEGDVMADNRNILPDDTKGKIELDRTVIRIFIVIWLCGMFVMFFYFILNCLYIHKKTEIATHLKENIWESEFVDSPFIFGLFRPKIYIPYGKDEKQLVYILAHERTHLKRKDHILKLAAFLILSVYWFHPLVWISYILLGRDIELACDEKAVLTMDKQERKNYLLALLSCSTARTNASVYPLAFGKIGIKERVIRMKKWKKQSCILIFSTFFACVIVTVCFFTNPKRAETKGVVTTQTSQTVPKETNKDFVSMEVKQASVNLSENTGADGIMIYYVDDKKIIFGGNFGLFVHDKNSGRIVQSLNLEYIGCNQTQGDNYCEIAVDKGGQRVYLNPVRQNKLYILDLLSDTLEERDYPKSDIWKDSSLELFHIENPKQVAYHDGKEEKICILNENDFTIGNCTYAECSNNEMKKKEEMVYYPLFLHANR